MRIGQAAPAALLGLPPALLLLAALRLGWHVQGSIAATDWLGYAVLTALLLATVAGARAGAAPARPAAAAIVALAALAVWATVSLTWSPLPTLARDEGLLTAWYAAVVALVAVSARSVALRLWTVAAAALALGGLAVATAAVLRFGADPLARYSHGRLDFPITYANAQAAMFAIGFWPATILAARRTTPVLLRAAALAAAAACVGGVLLAQSKGAVLGIVCATIATLALSPARLRLCIPTLLAFAGGAAAFRPLTGPFRVYRPAAEAAAIRQAGTALLVLTAAGAVAGLVYALVDRRVAPSERQRRVAARLAAALVLAAVAAGVAAAAIRIDHPARFLDDKWAAFTHTPKHERGATHLLTLGSYRYDYWTVAAHAFAEHPVAGIGARGFGPLYLVRGHSAETPARAHSVVMDALAEQGIVGFLLLASALGLLLATAARGARARRAPAAAGFGAGIVWLTQACVDWTWTFPAVTVPALVLLGAAVAQDGPALRARAAAPTALVAAAVALLAFAPVWIAGRIVLDATRSGDASSLSLARRLDPISVQPLVASYQLAPTPEARLRWIERAERKEPRSVGLRYALGLALVDAGRRADGLAELRAALALKPGDPAILAALRRG